MSSVKVQGNPSGTGIFTIASPNSNTDRTLTLPDQTGTVVTTSSAAFDIGSGQFYKSATGDVGIGTSSPTARLTVASGTNEGAVRVGSDATYYGALSRVQATDEVRVGAYGASQNLTFYTVSTERARIDSSGNAMWNGTNTTTQNGNVGYIYKFFGAANNVIIPLESSGSNRFGVFEYRRTGRTSARTSQISIGENASSQGEVQVYSSAANADISGGVVLANGATSWSAISDMRLKNVTGTYTNALQDLAKIQAIKFTWKHDQNNTPQVGVSAQSVELVVPEAISTSRNITTPEDETDYLTVRYTELIPLMIASIQEQQSLIESLTARIAALEGAN